MKQSKGDIKLQG